MVKLKLLVLLYVINVNIIVHTNALQTFEPSCCSYIEKAWAKCCLLNTESRCCGACDSMTNRKGLSNTCSYFNTKDLNNTSNFIPTGQTVDFTITTFVRECSGRSCLRTNLTCNLECYCCSRYSGDDPGFMKVSVLTSSDDSSKYSKDLSCTIPSQGILNNGTYFFSCIFTGWGMASPDKTITLLLNSNAWISMQSNIPPLQLDVHIVAGNVSIPNCQYEWERSSSFIVKEFGTLKVLLYDAYGNKVSGTTGGQKFHESQLKITFQKHGHEEILDSNTSSVSAKVFSRVAFGVCIVTVYSTEVGAYVMTVSDNQNNKIAGMPTVFYVLPDKLAKFALYDGNTLLPSTKTYFEGDKWSNDFNINGGVSIMDLKIKKNYDFNMFLILYVWTLFTIELLALA